MSFSWSRWVGIIVKVFIQLRRDRLTFVMIIGIPVLQLILFGYAINADPKRLPTAVLSADSSPYSRTLLSAMQTSGYFRLDSFPANEDEVDELLAQGRVQFVAYPHNVFFPGIFLAVTVLAVNILGDGLRDTLDPKMSKKV